MITADLPSGVDADTGAVPDWAAAHPATLSLALGALKPAHVLEPAASACGTIRLINLGLSERPADCIVATAPHLPQPGPESHKYTRGMVAVVVGAMEAPRGSLASPPCAAGQATSRYMAMAAGAVPTRSFTAPMMPTR